MSIRTITGILAAFSLASVVGFHSSIADAADVASVDIHAAGLNITPSIPPGYEQVVVTVADPTGTIVARLTSHGESLSWAPPSGATEGDWRYEVRAVRPAPRPTSAVSAWQKQRFPVHRTHGEFRFRANTVQKVPDIRIDRPQASLGNQSGTAYRLLYALLSAISGIAAADDLTSSSTVPTHWWDDTDGPGTFHWNMSADTGVGQFWLANSEFTDPVFPLVVESGEQIDGAIRIRQNGDIQFGLGTLYMDTVNNKLGIGTTTLDPFAELHIVDVAPQIALEEPGVGQAGLQYFGGIFGVFNDVNEDGNLTQALGLAGEHANPLSYVVTQQGDGELGSMLGINTGTPAAALHVTGADAATNKNNATQLIVENVTETTATRVMQVLRNNGDPQFLYENANSGEIWQLNPNGTSFVIVRGGTGQIEARISGAGNMVIAGDFQANSDRNSKDRIDPVDPDLVLDKVLDLEVARWHRTREADHVEHIGPMAQDFYSAFGLGDDETKISTLDTAGVALAAIQGLHGELAARDERIDTLTAELAEQSRRMAALEKRLAALPVAD